MDSGLEGGIPSTRRSHSTNPTFNAQHQDQIRYRHHQQHVRSRHQPGRVRRSIKPHRFGIAPDSAQVQGNAGGSSWGQLPIFRSHSERTDKVTFSQRQRLRRAGVLQDADTPGGYPPDGAHPPVKHRLKSVITFSERQRQRKRGLLRFHIPEDEVLDAVEQLFPGTHVDYTPHSSYSPFDSDASDFSPVPLFSRLRVFVQRRDSGATGNVVILDQQQPSTPSAPGVPRVKSSHLGSVAADSEIFSYDTRIQIFEGDGLATRKPGGLSEFLPNSGVGVGFSKIVLQQQSGRDASEHGYRLPGFVPIARADPQTQLEISNQQVTYEENGEPHTALSKSRRSGFKLKLRLGQAGRRLLSGAIAGAVSRTAVAPLETIRTHLMVGSHGHSVKDVFQWIMSHEGWTGLFRGNAINVIRVAPSKAIELFAYETVKKALTPKEGESPKTPLPVSSVAGSAAGITATVCMYPLELLKTRLTVQPEEYRGIFHALWRIVSEEGVLELYRGLVPSVIGIIPYAGANYFAYDTLRTAYKRVFKVEDIGNLETLLMGSAAGAFASTATFPLEVARKHMQVGALKGRIVYKGTLDALACIFKEQGFQGLYRGLGPSCLKLVPAAGLSFMTYEYLKRTIVEEEQSADDT